MDSQHPVRPPHLHVQTPRTLAVIGTAGRKEDKPKLTLFHWQAMVKATLKVIEIEKITHLVSGGAAWADHVAVEIHRQTGLPLRIHFPTDTRNEMTAQYYHTQFSRHIGRNTWEELNEVRDIVRGGNFLERNTRVAKDADVFMAMTFGEQRLIKPGGTLDTCRKMWAMGKTGYHLDLNCTKLYYIELEAPN